MKHVLTGILFSLSLLKGERIWFEDFNSDEGAGIVGPDSTLILPESGKWSIDVRSANLTAATDWFQVRNGIFEARDVDGECIWMSEEIDISGYEEIQVTVDISENGTLESSDYINLFCILDNADEEPFDEHGENRDDFDPVVARKTYSQGNSLVILIKAKNNSGTEYLRFDDVTITGVRIGGDTMIQFASPDGKVREGDAVFSLPVVIENEDSIRASTVHISLVGGTASPGDDVSLPSSQTIVFPPGSSSPQIVSTGIIDDDILEGMETLIFQLDGPAGGRSAVLGPNYMYLLEIEDNELVLNEIHADPDGLVGDSNGDGYVHTSQDEFIEGVNTSNGDLDISGLEIWDRSRRRHIFPPGSVLRRNQAVVIFGGGEPRGSFGGSRVQIATSGSLGLNNGGDEISIRIGEEVVVATHTYGPEAGDNQSITRDPDLSGPFIKHRLADRARQAPYSPGVKVTSEVFTGNISIDETGAITQVSEEGESDTYFVRLDSPPVEPVFVQIRADSQLNVTPDSIVFTEPWEDMFHEITVTGNNDLYMEGVHTGTIRHVSISQDSNYHNLPIREVIVIIVDNDSAGIRIRESDGQTEIAEGGRTDSYRISLLSKPRSDVVVTLSFPNRDIIVDPISLRWAPEDNNIDRILSVQAVDDQEVEGVHMSSIQHTVSSDDSAYNGLTVEEIQVTIIDNDIPSLVINEIQYNPPGVDTDLEFIELVNPGEHLQDIGGASVTSGFQFTFPPETKAEPGDIILLAKNAATFAADSIRVFQWESGTLTNMGESIVLSTAVSGGVVIDSVTYGPKPPWPTASDGGGSSLELKSPYLDNALPNNWQASFIPGGSPGQSNTINTSPYIGDDEYTGTEDKLLRIEAPGIFKNDHDDYSNSLSLRLISSVTHGSLSLNADGSFLYEPLGDYAGIDRFTYLVNDGWLDSDTGTVTLTITPVNDPPDFSLESKVEVNEDFPEPVVIQVVPAPIPLDERDQSVIYRVNPPTLSFAGVVLDSGTGELTLTALPDSNGSEMLTVIADDGQPVNSSAEKSLTVMVKPVNDAPFLQLAFPDRIDILWYSPVHDTRPYSTVIHRLENHFHDVDRGDILEYIPSTLDPGIDLVRSEKTALLTTQLVVYPAVNYTGTARISVLVMDPENASVRDTLEVSMISSNHPPVITDIPDTSMLEDGLLIFALDLSDRDNNPLVAKAASDTSSVNVFLTLGSDTTLTVLPAQNWNGSANIDVTVSDGYDSVNDTFVLHIEPVNDPPIAFSSSVTVEEDSSVLIVLQGIDIEGDSLIYHILTAPEAGSLSAIFQGDVVYSSYPDLNGLDQFTFTVGDGQDISEPGFIDILINPANDPPVFEALNDTSLMEDETLPILLKARDIDRDSLSYSAIPGTDSVSIHIQDDTLWIIPGQNWYGETEIVVSVTDGILYDSEAFSLTVNPVNDPPAVRYPMKEIYVHEDHADTIIGDLNKVFYDPDDSISFSFMGHDTDLVKVQENGGFVRLHFILDAYGSTEIIFTASDPFGLTETDSLALIIEPQNDPPSQYKLIHPGDSSSIRLTGDKLSDTLTYIWEPSEDVDGDPIHYRLTIIGQTGSMVFDTVIVDTAFQWIYQSFLAFISDSTQGPVDLSWTITAHDSEYSISPVNGPFRLTLDITELGIKIDRLIPGRYKLYQNYPNPFNTFATIPYDLPETGRIIIHIYDLGGRMVRTLVDRIEEPGFKSIYWDGRDDKGMHMSSGIYFYRMTVKEQAKQDVKYHRVRKMILLK